jgi:hypothetical protein
MLLSPDHWASASPGPWTRSNSYPNQAGLSGGRLLSLPAGRKPINIFTCRTSLLCSRTYFLYLQEATSPTLPSQLLLMLYFLVRETPHKSQLGNKVGEVGNLPLLMPWKRSRDFTTSGQGMVSNRFVPKGRLHFPCLLNLMGSDGMRTGTYPRA